MTASRKRSRKRSASSKPPDPVFFVERSLGSHIVANALRTAGAQVTTQAEQGIPADAGDEVWLELAGRHGWVALTKDTRIVTRQNEIDLLMTAGVAAFVLRRGSLQGPEVAQIFVNALPQMRRLLAQTKRPFVGGITRVGRVRVLMTEKQWKRTLRRG